MKTMKKAAKSFDISLYFILGIRNRGVLIKKN